MLHSTEHWQKTVHGWSGLQPPAHLALYDRLTRFPDDDSLRALAEIHVDYLVVHTDLYPPGEWEHVERRLAAYQGRMELRHVDGAGRVYALTTPHARLDTPPEQVYRPSIYRTSMAMKLTRAEFHVLLALQHGTRHGDRVMQDVETMSEGRLRLGPGTLYTAIKRLAAAGLIAKRQADAERRRCYRLTRKGKAVAEDEARQLSDLVKNCAQARTAAIPVGNIMTPERFYAALLALYLKAFRDTYEHDVLAAFYELRRTDRRPPPAFWRFVLGDLVLLDLSRADRRVHARAAAVRSPAARRLRARHHQNRARLERRDPRVR